MKETFKDIEIGGKKFRIRKFDALTGSYIIYTLLTQMLPMGLSEKIDGLPSGDSKAPPMTKEKFMEVQLDCLRACSEIVPTGDTVTPIPLLTADGRWSSEELASNAPLVIMLTIHVLGYNAQSFFDENVLDMFKTSITQLSSSFAPT
jgi:hypothetical protein